MSTSVIREDLRQLGVMTVIGEMTMSLSCKTENRYRWNS